MAGELEHRDGCSGTDALPRQAEHQGLKLLCIQLDFRAVPHARPKKTSLIQAPGSKLNPQAIMHQHFHAIGTTVGKQISTVRLRRTEHRHDPRQRSFSACAHVHGLGGKPDGIDGNLGFEGFGYRLSIQQAVQ